MSERTPDFRFLPQVELIEWAWRPLRETRAELAEFVEDGDFGFYEKTIYPRDSHCDPLRTAFFRACAGEVDGDW